ncbi:phage tail tape measure protein [Paracoccus aminophilus]|uniref:Phage tail tape measure protein n=1 Tax=Paracoccus aminophilus JCM 7686 TaxID=1367847 RepID=S5XPK6_PARAH|nr:hypothetical protein [Paracoccus aminophilus]AGT09274.1 hypothetical protein JCM7686_2195 [Paracoccus aminophilus JCM 7686]
MALDETGLLIKLEANVSKWEKDFNRAISQQNRASQRMEQLAKRNAQKIAQQYEGLGPKIGKAFEGIPSALKGLGSAFLGGLAGGLAVGGITEFTRSLGEATRGIAEIKNEAARAGVTTTVFQEWKYLADENRISVDALADGFKELGMRADEFIVTGVGPAAEAFTRLGYSADQLKAKLKDPSALMLEVLGRASKFDKSAQNRILDETFGGTGAEQLAVLLGQGEDAMRATIERAHEVGAVLDSDVIDRAAEVDRKFTALQASVSNFGKRVVISVAEGVVALTDFRDHLDALFPNEAVGRQVLGDAFYDDLAQSEQAAQENAATLRGLTEQYNQLADSASSAAPALLDAAATLRLMGNDDAADALQAAADRMQALAGSFQDGTMTGEEFAAQLTEVKREADNTFASLSDVDRASFGTVIGELGVLGGAIAGVLSLAQSLSSAMASLADGKAVKALRDRNEAEAASMASLDAMTKANENFAQSEAERNAATTASMKLEEARADARKRAAAAGAVLTEAEITTAAEAALAGDAARAAADKAARGGGKPKGGGGAKAEKLDDYAREVASIKEKTTALETEASVLLAVAASGEKMAGAMDFAQTKASLLTAALSAGKSQTPELIAQVDALARAYVTAGQKAEQAGDQMKSVEDNTKQGAQAFTDLVMSATEGSEAFAGALRNLGMQILQNSLLKLILGFAGQGGPFGSAMGWLGSALTPPAGFAAGGYTGDGGKHQVAGLVHRGEFVLSKAATERIGVGNLERLHQRALQGYSRGGLVGAAKKAATPASDSLRGAVQHINVTGGPITVNASGGTPEQNGDLARQIAKETERGMRDLVRDELVRQRRSGGILR